MVLRINRERILVTAALPYANGPLHLGHMVEYVQADVFVRANRLMENEVVFVCADDTHGTPIQVNAMKLGITPEALIKKYYTEHSKDFKDFLVSFDSFYSTNSPENKHYSDLFFHTLKEKGLIYTKEVEQLYSEKDKMFLPDRFVKGKCPVCKAEEQYGDVCERCNSAYKATELIEPRSVISGDRPVLRKSVHYFFRLSKLAAQLKKWLTENKNLQKEIVNYCLNWIKEGLQDWDISRDGPYFGFKIPGEKDKYYYVWLDAPIGYIASTQNYCNRHKKEIDLYWKDEHTKIFHFIGKDIIYFHFLFWPAMLMAAGFNLPYNVPVHGFLTINKEKMSKSRGTFITARDYLKELAPEYLRFYYASNLTNKVEDIDLDIEDFKNRVNNDLVGNLANFVYRVLSFANENFESRLSAPEENPELERSIREKAENVIKNYQNYDFRRAVQGILEISALGNKYFQENEPWKLVKKDKEKCREIVTTAANIARIVSILTQPIIPSYSERVWKQLGLGEQKFEDIYDVLKAHKVGKAEILLRKINDVRLLKGGKAPKGAEAAETGKIRKEASKASLLNLKVAKVLKARDHPEADKLIILDIDLGKEKRQIVAGLREYYKSKDFVGKNIIVVTNLKPAKLRGVESNGMLLAADAGDKVVVLEAAGARPGEQALFGDEKPGTKQLTFEDFQKIGIVVKNNRVTSGGKALRVSGKEIIIKVKDGAKVR